MGSTGKAWRQIKTDVGDRSIRYGHVDSLLSDNMANINRFDLDNSTLTKEFLRAILKIRGVPFNSRCNKLDLLEKFWALEDDLKVSKPRRKVLHPLKNPLFNILTPEIRKRIFEYVYADEIFHTKPDEHGLSKRQKSCINRHWEEYYTSKDWKRLDESPVNILLVSKQWYEEAIKVFWANSMLDVADFVFAYASHRLDNRPALHFRSLRVDLGSLTRCRVGNLTYLMQKLDQIDEIAIQVRTDTAKVLNEQKRKWKDTTLARWGAFTLFGKHETRSAGSNEYDEYDGFWLAVQQRKVKKIQFEPVVAIQAPESTYVDSMMRSLQRSALQKVGAGVKVLLPGE